jgi:hypothetical protein
MIFQPYSLSCTISSYPPSMGSSSPEKPVLPSFFNDFFVCLRLLHEVFHCDISMDICRRTWIGSYHLFSFIP